MGQYFSDSFRRRTGSAPRIVSGETRIIRDRLQFATCALSQAGSIGYVVE
jgi:hypothetical protein